MWGQEFAEAARPSMKVPRQARRARRAAGRRERPRSCVSASNMTADALIESSVYYTNGMTALSAARQATESAPKQGSTLLTS